MTRFYIGLALLAAVAALHEVAVKSAYNKGEADCKAEQVKVDAKAYQDIIKGMQNAGVDLNDADAVDCELRKLAGEPDTDECGGL